MDWRVLDFVYAWVREIPQRREQARRMERIKDDMRDAELSMIISMDSIEQWLKRTCPLELVERDGNTCHWRYKAPH